MNLIIEQLNNSDKAFRRAVLLGFIIALGPLLIQRNIEPQLPELIFQIILGGGFFGIILNVSLMLLASSLTWPLRKMTHFSFSQEQIFSILIWSHMPLFLGIVHGFKEQLNIRINPSFFWTLEVISLIIFAFIMIKLKLKKYKA